VILKSSPLKGSNFTQMTWQPL